MRSRSGGWLTSVKQGTTSFASSITYHPNGMVNTVVHGNLVNTIYGIDPYAMTRPSSIAAKYSTSTYWTTGTYAYDGAGNVKAMGTDYAVYDRVHRIVEGTSEWVSSSNGKKQAYTYDPYGNRLTSTTTVNGTVTDSSTRTISTSTNRITTTASYDEAGNMTTLDATYTYAWDPLGNMRALQGPGQNRLFIYTADDERLWEYDLVLNRGEYVIRGLDAKPLRMIVEDGSSGTSIWSWAQDWVWRDGVMLSGILPTGTIQYHPDHLGTPRYISNASRGQVGRHAYYPFGVESTTTTQNSEQLKFTGHERDASTACGASCLDYLHARYYDANLARFLTTDPILGNPKLPQSWNRYTYVRNNPLAITDPTGLYVVNCTSDAKTCQAQEAKFEIARKQALRSTSLAVRRGAAAYGNPNDDNGVTVSFNTGGGGTTLVKPKPDLATGKIGFSAEVGIDIGESGVVLESAVAHEGTHVANGQDLYASFQPDYTFNAALNLTLYDDEVSAYLVTAAYATATGKTIRLFGKYDFKPHMSQQDLTTVINNIILKEYGKSPSNPGQKIYPE